MRHFIRPYLTGLLTCNLWRQFKLLNELRVLHVVLIIDIVSLVLGQNLISQLLLLHLTLSNFVCVAHFVELARWLLLVVALLTLFLNTVNIIVDFLNICLLKVLKIVPNILESFFFAH